jgi:hypothetical protein
MASASPRRLLLARAALCALVLLLFRDALAGGVFYKRDVHLVWHPQVEAIVHAVAEGAWPVWDPSPAFGQPLLADPGAQVLYPPTWLNLVLKPWTYYTLFAAGHVLFSGLSFLALARRWGLSTAASWTGAAAWTLSGPFLSHVDLWHHFAGVSYLPAVFLFAEDALESRRARDVLRLGVVLGLQLLAGSGDACTMTLVALVAHALVVHAEPRRLRSALAMAGRLGAAVAVAAVIGTGVWLPALEAASRSSRRSLPDEVRTYWSAHPASIAETVLAGVPSALPLDAPSRARLFEGREPFIASLYLGLPCLALVAGAFVSTRRRRVAALALLLVAAVLLAAGRHAPFYDALVALLPPLRVLRYPVKAMSVAAFAWAGLVALGTEAWLAGAARRRTAAALLAPAALAALAAAVTGGALLRDPAGQTGLAGLGFDSSLAASLPPLGRSLLLHAALGAVAVAALLSRGGRVRPALAAVAACVAVIDLAAAHPWPNPTAPVALYTHRPEILRAFDGVASPRVYSYNYGETAPDASDGGGSPDRLESVPAGFTLSAASALGQQMCLAPQTAGRWRVRQGFDVDYRGLHAAPLATFSRLARLAEDRPDDLVRILRLAAVTHVVALHDVSAGRLRPVHETPGLFAAPVRVWAVDGALPRARVVGGVRVAADPDAARVLLDPAFDGGREALLPEGAPRAAPAGFKGWARITEERSDRLRIEAELNHDGYLLLADSYDPGWRVRVDGRSATLLRADMAFRAVALSAGRHAVDMAYRPVHALAAGLLTLVSLAVGLGFLASSRRA